MNKSNVLLVIILILSCLQATTAITNLVPLMCKEISRRDPVHVRYESCVSIIESDPRSRPSTTPKLGQISFELGISKAQAITTTINEILKQPASSGVAKTSLKYCLNIYSGIPGELRAGIEALNAGNFETANARVGATMKATMTCRNVIKDANGDAIAPLIQEMNDFDQLGAICLGFIWLLRNINY